MSTLVCDIETVGESWDSLDTITQKNLTRWIARATDNLSEQETYLHGIQQSLGLSPFTGQIVAIGVYDIERNEGVVYHHDEVFGKEQDVGVFVYRSRSEKEMLEDFWDGVKEYDTLVTFNGRRFDVPYLMIRSMVHGVIPSRNFAEHRYLSQQKEVHHVDVLDQLTFYGVLQKRPSLHQCCRAFGIESPIRDGVGGEDVAELFLQKKFRDIADHNTRDIIATTELYQKWLVHLAPLSFKNKYL